MASRESPWLQWQRAGSLQDRPHVNFLAIAVIVADSPNFLSVQIAMRGADLPIAAAVDVFDSPNSTAVQVAVRGADLQSQTQ